MMKRFYIIVLCIILVLPSLVVYADPKDEVISPELEETVKSITSINLNKGSLLEEIRIANTGLESLNKLYNVEGNRLDLFQVSSLLWQFQTIIAKGYLLSLALNENDFTESITSQGIQLNLILKNSIISYMETIDSQLGMYSDTSSDIATVYTGIQLPEVNHLEYNADLATTRQYLKTMLERVLPSIYDSYLSYVKSSKLDSENVWTDNARSLTLASISDLSRYNEKYLLSNDTNTIIEADKIDTSIASDLLTSKYLEMCRDAEQTEQRQIEDEMSLANVNLDEFSKLHEMLSFVKKLDEESLSEAVGKENITIDDLTGEAIWEILEGKEAKYEGNIKPKKEYYYGYALRSQYLAMFSATAVYQPLVSKVGSEDYIQAMLSLVSANQQQELLDLFTAVSSYKKPLYAFTDKQTIYKQNQLGASWEQLSGNSQRLTLQDIIALIDHGKTSWWDKQTNKESMLIAATIKGKMVKDADAWVYINNELTKGPNDNPKVLKAKVEDAKNTNAGTSYSAAVLEIATANSTDPTPGTITAALLKNIYEDQYLRSYWIARASETLYIDAIGNIILSDGTLILPAAANPTFFAIPSPDPTLAQQTFNNTLSPISGTVSATSSIGLTNSWWYNPYTVAFWNSYPVLYGNNETPSIQAKKDSNKWILSYQDPTQVSNFAEIKSDSPIRNPFALQRNTTKYIQDKYVFITNPIKTKYHSWRLESRVDVGSTGYLFPYFTQTSGIDSTSPILRIGVTVMEGEISTSDKDDITKSVLNYYPLRLEPISSNATQIFPYNFNDNTANEVNTVNDFTAAKNIAANMYMYITSTDREVGLDVPQGNGILRESYLFINIICSVLDGIVTPMNYEKSISDQNIMTYSISGQMSDVFISFSRTLMNFGKNFKEFLGIGTPDDTSFFSPIYSFIMQFKFELVFFLLVILLLLFIKSRSYSKVIYVGLTLFVSIYGCLFVLPKTMPFFVGRPTLILTDKLVGGILLMHGEQYDRIITDDEKQTTDIGSVKLYDLTFAQAQSIVKDRGRNIHEFLTDKFWLDDQLGVYLDGTEIKLDLRTFWAINSVHSQWQEVNETNSDYAYQLNKTTHIATTELLNYYAPYYLLEEGLLNTLNTFLRYYQVPRSVVRYPNGMSKDTYVMNTYIHSYPFLVVLPEVQQSLQQEQNLPELMAIQSRFYPYGDILKLTDWLVEKEFDELEPEIANSLWGQTLWKNGYYDITYGKARRKQLIDKVNQETYNFLIRVTPEVGLVSDDNLIKLTAMYATFMFNNEISRFGQMVYPRNVAFDEFNVTDILTSVILKSTVRYMFYEVDLVSNVFVEKGIFGLLAADIVILGMIGISILNSILLPILYFGGVIWLIVIILLGKKLSNALLSILKMIGLIFFINFLSTINLLLYEWYSPILNIYILCTVTFIIAIVGFKCLISIIKSSLTNKMLHNGSVMTGKVIKQVERLTLWGKESRSYLLEQHQQNYNEYEDEYSELDGDIYEKQKQEKYEEQQRRYYNY